VFVDTNVLVQARFTSAPSRSEARRALAGLIGGRRRPRISRQVMREYLAVVTRPQIWMKQLPLADAPADVQTFERNFVILEDGAVVTEKLILLGGHVSFAGRQVHDANIVATMLAHGETRLLTCNASDFARFRPMIDPHVP
jgi:predicted nucleic acid-binding protein